MNDVTFGLTPDEIEDEARHFHAEGTVLVRAIAIRSARSPKRGTELAYWNSSMLHVQLVNVYELIGSPTVFGMDNAGTYSDGTPVSIVVGPPSSRGWSAPGDVYDC